MKQVKKLCAILLAFVLSMSLTTFSLAADTYTITISNSETGHTYDAYQIFSGDLAQVEGKAVLSNVQWGSGINSESFLTALKGGGAGLTGDYSQCDTAADVAKVLGGTPADAKAFAELAGKHLGSVTASSTSGDGSYTISGLIAGYYLVKDQDGSQIPAFTEYILKVVDNVTVTPKSGTTISKKKVQDINDSETTTYSQWQDSADHDIGDDVPFQLSATLPDNYDAYEEFAITFHDTQSAGLTFNADSVKVYVNSEGNTLTKNTDYTVNTSPGDGHTFDIVFADLKRVASHTIQAGDTIYVEYTSELNTNAVIGSQGNPNEMYLTYSNNPYSTTDRGQTAKDKVIVFTYKVKVNKVDPDSEPLEGATFTLEKFQYDDGEGTWNSIAQADTSTGTTFSFEGLDDGKYRLTETVTPAGYNSIDPIEFTVTATHDTESDDPKLTALNGTPDGAIQITFTPTLSDGSLSTNVVNEQGLELPSTGGIGTTIFYIAGIVLILGAASCLVVKLYHKKNT